MSLCAHWLVVLYTFRLVGILHHLVLYFIHNVARRPVTVVSTTYLRANADQVVSFLPMQNIKVHRRQPV